jgi:hypothetical protein
MAAARARRSERWSLHGPKAKCAQWLAEPADSQRRGTRAHRIGGSVLLYKV